MVLLIISPLLTDDFDKMRWYNDHSEKEWKLDRSMNVMKVTTKASVSVDACCSAGNAPDSLQQLDVKSHQL